VGATTGLKSQRIDSAKSHKSEKSGQTGANRHAFAPRFNPYSRSATNECIMMLQLFTVGRRSWPNSHCCVNCAPDNSLAAAGKHPLLDLHTLFVKHSFRNNSLIRLKKFLKRMKKKRNKNGPKFC